MSDFNNLNPFTEDDDATDADEMTTFDGSTISLSLSPLMTPVKQGNWRVNWYFNLSKKDNICLKLNG